MSERDAPAAIVLHRDDDVAVLVQAVSAGEGVALRGASDGATIRAAADIPAGHKLALRALPEGTEVRKYGEVIGRLTAAVAPGEHVHVHNLVSQRAR